MQLQNTNIQGFSRLKGLFRHGINYSTYEQIVPSTKRPVVGNIPKDILDVIVSQNSSNKKDLIKNIQNAYIEASKILFNTQKILMQAINRFSPDCNNVLDVIFRKIDILDASKDKIFEDKFSEYLTSAEEVLMKHFKTILPNLNNIIITPVNSGNFGDVYKCQLLDINKEKIIEDKVIKIFHPDNSLLIKGWEKIVKILEKYSNEEIIAMGEKKGHKYTEELLNNYRKSIPDMIAEYKDRESNAYFARKHGAFAEANSSEYIRFMNGHKITEKDGLVIPDMYVLSAPSFHIAKYIKASDKAEKSFNFKRLGLEHEDLDINPDNLINGICIDIGGASTASKEEEMLSSVVINLSTAEEAARIKENQKTIIVGDKENTKILKKLVNNDRKYPKTKHPVNQTRLNAVINEINDKNLI